MSNIVTKIVDRTHPVCQELAGSYDPIIPKSAMAFFSRAVDGPANHAVIATFLGKIVGIFRYDITRGRYIHAYGTWVALSFRRMGLGTRMWERALRKHTNIHGAKVVCLHAGSYEMVHRLSKKHSRLKFDITKYYLR